MKMKKKNALLFGLAAVAVAGLVAYAYTRSRKKKNEMAGHASDEGYETAHDVLFPENGKRDRKLKFGPVIPS